MGPFHGRGSPGGKGKDSEVAVLVLFWCWLSRWREACHGNVQEFTEVFMEWSKREEEWWCGGAGSITGTVVSTCIVIVSRI